MKKLIFPLIVLISPLLTAQEPPSIKSCLEISVGNNQNKEQNLHQKVHRGLVAGLDYSRFRTKTSHSFYAFGLRYSRLKTGYEDVSKTADIQLFGEYAYQYLVENGEKSQIFMGPALRLQYKVSFYPNWDESHLYWANGLSLGFRGMFSHRLSEKRSLALDLAVPVFSVLSRPKAERLNKIDEVSVSGILSSLHTNPEAGTWNRNFFLHTGLSYLFHLNDHTSQALHFSVSYGRMKAKEGLPAQNLMYSLGYKFYFK